MKAKPTRIVKAKVVKTPEPKTKPEKVIESVPLAKIPPRAAAPEPVAEPVAEPAKVIDVAGPKWDYHVTVLYQGLEDAVKFVGESRSEWDVVQFTEHTKNQITLVIYRTPK